MNMAVTDSLSREQVRQLLAAVGSAPSDDSAEIESTEYDWRRPHYFSREELVRLDDFTKNLAAAVAEKFTQFYHSDFDVTMVSTTQHFAGELLDQICGGEQNNYYVALGPRGESVTGGCGFIAIPEQTAFAWVTYLLGEADAEASSQSPSKKDSADSGEVRRAGAGRAGSQKSLSQLEESLLLDIAAAIVAALSVCHSDGFEPATTIVRGEPPLELQQFEELCKIVFAVRKAGSENGSEAYLVIRCGELARQWRVTGKAANPAGKSSAEQISQAITEHLQQMPVSVTAQLACTYLTFQELAAIRPCDILLLDKAVDESVELIVQGRTLFQGRPAKSAGQYAVVITESLSNKPLTPP